MSLRPTSRRSSSQLPPNDSRTVPDRRRDGKPRGPPAETMGNKGSKPSSGGGGGRPHTESSAAAAYSYGPTSSEIELHVKDTFNSILRAGIRTMQSPGQELAHWSVAQIMADPDRIRDCYDAEERYSGDKFNSLARACGISVQEAQQAVRRCLPRTSGASSHRSASTASTRSGIADFSENYRQHTYTGNQALVVYIVRKHRNTMGSDYGEMLIELTLRKLKSIPPPAAPQGYNGKDAAVYILENKTDYVRACLRAWDASVAETDGKTDTQLGARARYIDYH